MSVDYNQNGYIGTKMSVRAAWAYESGEMPISKWTKKEFFDKLDDLFEYHEVVEERQLEILELLKKLHFKEIKNMFLYRSSWHHTGKYANATDFYSIDEDKILELNLEKIDSIISNREERKPRKAKEFIKPLYVTAYVQYYEWEGTRKHPKKVEYKEIVTFMSTDKIVRTCYGNKRMTSITILAKKELKTKFYSKEKLRKELKL